jgi:hypothetical protein
MNQHITLACIITTMCVIIYYQLKERYDRDNYRNEWFMKGLKAWFLVADFSDEELHDLSVKETELLVYCNEYQCHRIAIYNHAQHCFEDKLTAVVIQDVKRFRFVSTENVTLKATK